MVEINFEHIDFYTKGFTTSAPFEFTAKSARTSTKGTKHSIEEKVTFDRSEDGGLNATSEIKLKQNKAKGNIEAKLSSSKVKVEKTCNLEQLNQGDTTGSFLGRLEHKIGKDKPDLTAGVKYGLTRVNDDVEAYFEGNATYKGLKDWAGDFSGLLGYQKKFFLGSQVFYDVKAKKATEITGTLAADLDGNFVYLHQDCLNHVSRVGFNTKQVPYLDTFAAETEVALKEAGPIQDRATTKVAFTLPKVADSQVKIKLDITKKVFAHLAFTHKINNHLTFTMTDQVNPIGIFNDSANNEYNTGIAIEGNF